MDLSKGHYLLTCGACGQPLGAIEGATGESGRATCQSCGWWIDWRFVDDPDYQVPIPEFYDWKGLSEALGARSV